eukprot:gb/GECH01000120.1/.p1 GENE.gb/GECH01000120.1/~~gb/GECH01000120.1/.p1  ORF type:complete len:784 (+),score=208.52 gb/GECH01000120.1/:1-2352(+)
MIKQNLTPPITRLVKSDPELRDSNATDKPKMKLNRRPLPSAPLPSLNIPSSLFEPNNAYGRFQDLDSKSSHTCNTQFSNDSKQNEYQNTPKQPENPRRSKRRIRSQNYDHYLNSGTNVEESCVMKWIQSFKIFGKNTSKSELGEILSSGVKLCDFVSFLFKREIPGVAKNPKNNAAAVSNINRALQILREQKSMPPRYLWSTKEILNGNNKVAFGLLSDIMEGIGKKPKQKNETKASSSTKATAIPNTNNVAYTDSSSDIISSSIPSPKAGPSISQTIETSTKNKDIENVVKRWLHDRNIDVLLEKNSHENILADPLRNGQVIEKMLNILEGRKIALPHSRPRSLRQVKENLNAAISTVRSSRPLPPDLQASASKIIKGSQNTLWRLLYHIIHAYDGSETIGKKGYSGSSIYKADEMLKLERSVINWLEKTGLIPENSSIDIVMAGMQSGTLLCELVPLISGSRIIGIHRNAKTPALASSNIRRGMEALGACKKMSRRFLGLQRQKELLNGNKNVVLGLLEDIRRCYDGEPPIKGQPSKPYLGYAIQDRDKTKSGSQSQKQQNSVNPQNLLVPSTPPTELRPDYPAPAQLPNLNLNPPDFELYPEAFMPTWEPSSQLLPAPNQMKQPMETQPIFDNHHHHEDEDFYQYNETPENNTVGRIESEPHVRSIHKWVQSLGINVLDSPQLSLERDFCDGVQLCNIVEKVFPNARLNGITSSCKSSAARLFNIRKALQYLGEQKVISEEMVLQDEAVLNGNVDHVTSLLQKICSVHRRQQQLTTKRKN